MLTEARTRGTMARRTRSGSRHDHRWLWFAILALAVVALVGCAWPPWNPPNPEPTPTPTPTPPPWECSLPYPGCHEYDPPLQCSSEDKPCWHNPTQNPEHCEEAPKCEDPEPPPLPEPQCVQFVDRGGSLRPLGESCDCYFGHAWNPCDPVEGCTFPQGVPESDFTSGPTTHILGTQVNAALERTGLCPVGSDCNAGPSADDFFDTVNADLRSTGLCAGRHKENPPGASDEIAVATSCTGWWEGYHVYNYGGGKIVWSPNAARPSWKIDPKWCEGGVPPPSGECDLPHPDLTKMKFNSSEQGSHLDTTWITNYQPDYCASIGYCCMPGTGTPPNTCGSPGCVPRGGCPVRGDGDPEREVCEAELCDQKWECNGEPYPPYRGNPAQTDCRGSYKTYCANPAATTVLEGTR